MKGPGSFLFDVSSCHKDRVQCIIQVGDHVWSCSSSGALLIHNVSGDLLQELQIPSRGLTLDYASCMVFANGEVWCGLSSGGLCAYTSEGALCAEIAEGHSGPITCIAWNERADTLWTGGGDNKILGWDRKKRSRLDSPPLEGHGDWIRCLLVCNGRVWSGSDDKTVRIWPEGGGNATVVEAHRGGVLCLARVGDEVWSGGSDRQIWRMDLAGAEISPLVGHKGRVVALACCGKLVWSGGSDKRCILWSSSTARTQFQVDDFSGSVNTIASVEGNVWVGTGDGRMRVFFNYDVGGKESPKPIPPLLPQPEVSNLSKRDTLFDHEDEEEESFSVSRSRRQRAPKKEVPVAPSPAFSPIKPSSTVSTPKRSHREERSETPKHDLSRRATPVMKESSKVESPRYTPRTNESVNGIQQPRPQPAPARLYEPPAPVVHQAHPPAFRPEPQSAAPYGGYPPRFQESFAQQPPSFYAAPYPVAPVNSTPSFFYPPTAAAAQPSVLLATTTAGNSSNDSFVAYLRDSYQQLRNAYSTLQEKHELLREQHHKQLVQIEEDHRRQMEHLRKELALEHERECARLKAECDALRASRNAVDDIRMLNGEMRRRIRAIMDN